MDPPVQDNLEKCETYLGHIAEDVDSLMSDFGELTSASSLDDLLVKNIDDAVDDIETWTDLMYAEFKGPDGYRHEKFTDALLDAMSTEAAARSAVVAALKCKGVAQSTVDEFANEYTQRIQGRIDKYFDKESKDCIAEWLRNSDFYTWPETLYVENRDKCREWTRCPNPTQPECCQMECVNDEMEGFYNNVCILWDGYRHDLQADLLDFGCDCYSEGSCFTRCVCNELIESDCSAMKEKGTKHAQGPIV